jgi:hypothetical protein
LGLGGEDAGARYFHLYHFNNRNPKPIPKQNPPSNTQPEALCALGRRLLHLMAALLGAAEGAGLYAASQRGRAAAAANDRAQFDRALLSALVRRLCFFGRGGLLCVCDSSRLAAHAAFKTTKPSSHTPPPPKPSTQHSSAPTCRRRSSPRPPRPNCSPPWRAATARASWPWPWRVRAFGHVLAGRGRITCCLCFTPDNHHHHQPPPTTITTTNRGVRPQLEGRAPVPAARGARGVRARPGAARLFSRTQTHTHTHPVLAPQNCHL